jgi:hypothetical protein
MVGQGQYQAVVDELESVIGDIEAKLARFGSAALAALRALDALDAVYDVEPYRHMITANRRVLERMTQQQIDAFWALCRGIKAPLVMWRYHDAWKQIKLAANEVAAGVDHPLGRLGSRWDGTAASKYYGHVPPQVKAAARIGSTADKTNVALMDMAQAGLKFYVTLHGVAALFLVALAAAVVNLALPIPNVPGAILALTAGLAAAAAATAYAVNDLIGAQAKAAEILSSEAGDPIGFIDGRWPVAVTGQFANDSGNRNDWVARP